MKKGLPLIEIALSFQSFFSGTQMATVISSLPSIGGR